MKKRNREELLIMKAYIFPCFVLLLVVCNVVCSDRKDLSLRQILRKSSITAMLNNAIDSLKIKKYITIDSYDIKVCISSFNI